MQFNQSMHPSINQLQYHAKENKKLSKKLIERNFKEKQLIIQK